MDSQNRRTEEERLIYEGVYNLKINQLVKENNNNELEEETKIEKPQYGNDILRLQKEIKDIISNKKSSSIIMSKRDILENMDKESIIAHIMADDLDDYIEKQIVQQNKQQTGSFLNENKDLKLPEFENTNQEKKEFISLEDLANTVYSNIETKVETPIKNDKDDIYIDLEDFQNSLMDFYKENNQKTYIVNDENGNVVKYKLSYKNIKEFIEKLQDSCKYVLSSQTKITNDNTNQEKVFVNKQDILENMSSLFRKKHPWMNISSILPIQEKIDETSSEKTGLYTFSYDGEENELGNIVLTLENGEKIAVPNGIDPTVPGTLFSNEDGSITYKIGQINEENKPVISVEFNDITKKDDNANSINQTDSIIDAPVGGKR